LVKSDTRPRPTVQEIIVDDYREAYHWLRDKTPEDARVMAWWD
jgi:dolichyl-diphosphooligosaccharide--protein glycosyltransferase